MGRGKLIMELIEKEKTRSITFQKRKKGLMKKAYEFSTLCGVDTCMIIYGPKLSDRPVELGTWPETRDQVECVIERYKTDTKLKPTRASFDLSDFLIDRKTKVNNETSRLRKNIFEARYPTWDDRIEMLSEDQLTAVLDVMDTKLEAAGMRINRIKGNQHMMVGKATSATVVSHCPQPPPKLIQNQFNSMQALCQDQLFDHAQWSSHMFPFDPNFIHNSFKKLLHGDYDHWTHQLGSVSTSDIHAPLNIDQYPSTNYNMVPAGVMENTIMSNHPSASMNYYDITRQFSPQYMPMMSNISAHMPYGFQVNDLYHDIGEFDMKNKHLL
ncbi:agamous-like MADS-box protein MADS3 [Alnus glutinosa]|uniref:agamous-like MADS-box protein MADS3 n=1 Tax=Alnus glutinosa TaxID=3517 RepID=UPI002D76597D|nr:agamous-like MADS-box protein MADS3 [Alnus glutinosa]